MQIKVSEVLECLDKGMTRDEIADHFGITKLDCKRLFQHPQLKNKRPKKQPAFELVDDVSVTSSNPNEHYDVDSKEETESSENSHIAYDQGQEQNEGSEQEVEENDNTPWR